MSADSAPMMGNRNSSHRRLRSWLIFLAGAGLGLVVGAAIPLAIAYKYGPRSTDYSDDPLTGRHKVESTWLGFTTERRIDETIDSKWADLHSIPKLYPGQYGWIGSTHTGNGWFSRSSIACGHGCGIVHAISSGQIQLDGKSPAETLQEFQTEYIAAYHEHASGLGIIKKWQGMQDKFLREHPRPHDRIAL